MEKFGLVDKTKEELIDIALKQQETEQQLRVGLENANTRIAELENDLSGRMKSIRLLAIMYIAMMVYGAIIITNRL